MNESLFITHVSIIYNKFLLNRNSTIGVLSLLDVIWFGLIASPVAVSASSSDDFSDIRKTKIGIKGDLIKKILGQDLTPNECLDGEWTVVAEFIILAILGLIHSNLLVAVCIDDIQLVDDGYNDVYEISHKYYNENDYNEKEYYYNDDDKRQR